MTTDMFLVLVVLAATAFLFVSEWLRVDVVALLALLTLTWLGLVEPKEALAGFSSNAVISIIGVMILGYGVDRTGVMAKLTRPLLRVAGVKESRLVGLVMVAVGSISGVMQNIGAAALFLPALLRISQQRKLPASRLLMPVGFAAILGGTLTMVASGPLIILGDLLRQGGLEPYGLFDVTPVGALLLIAGVLYFVSLGRWVLPSRVKSGTATDPQQELRELWQLPDTVHGCVIPNGSRLIGMTIEQARLWLDHSLNLLALRVGAEVQEAPWRQTQFASGQELALLGGRADYDTFVGQFGLEETERARQWSQEFGRTSERGFAEFVVRPRARVVGRTLRELQLRKNHGIEPLMLLTGDGNQSREFSDRPFQPGNALVAFGTWERLRAFGRNEGFLPTTPIDTEATDSSKGPIALVIFGAALVLAMIGLPLSISLLSGALAMVLFRVVPMDAAYRAVDWRTVFLLAGLIPLGTAMEKSGTAAYVAQEMTGLLQGSPTFVVLTAIAVLTTLFSLFMSNVAATVLLVPLVLVIGEQTGIDARALALLVAVTASNSFVLPTHQVNALFAGPGSYRNADFIKAGGIMTLLFLVIVVTTIGLLYLK